MLIIMIITGVFGGLVNFSRFHVTDHMRDPNEKYPSAKWTLFKFVIAGVAATLIVPLFLQMISSDLIDNTEKESSQWFIFISFCLIASISSNRFIDTLSEQVLRQVTEAKEEAGEAKKLANENKQEISATKANVQGIILTETVSEEETNEEPSTENQAIKTDKPLPFYNDIQHPVSIRILDFLDRSTKEGFKFNSFFRIESQTGADTYSIENALGEMIHNYMVSSVKTDDSRLFGITNNGRTHLNSYKKRLGGANTTLED